MAVTSGLSVPPDFHGSTIASTGPRSAWALSWPLGVGMVLFVCLMNAGGLPLLGDPDSHWHIAVGNWILAHRSVPTVDTFSFTFAGQPWIAKEWLSQLLIAFAYNLGGWGGVTALAAAAIAASFALLLRLLLRDLTPLLAAMFTIAAIVMSASHFLARPHVLAFPVMLWWVAGLVRAVEERRAPEPFLLLAMLLWANLHGGFTLGLLLCGAFALDALTGARDAVERRALFIGWVKFGSAAVLVACITPYGPESILVTLRIFGLGEALGVVSEWKAPDFQGQPMQELILLVALYGVLSRGLKLPLIRLLIVIGFVHLYLRHARNAELLAMLVPLVIAPLLARQWPSLRPRPEATTEAGPFRRRMHELARPAGHAVMTLCLALAGLYAAGMIAFAGISAPTSTMPAAALQYALDNGRTGNVLNFYNYGGYLIRAGVPTFIDGRGELYGGGFIKRYAEAVNLRGDEPLERLIERHAIDWTLFPKDQPINKLLAHLPGWRRAYSDDASMIFVRDR